MSKKNNQIFLKGSLEENVFNMWVWKRKRGKQQSEYMECLEQTEWRGIPPVGETVKYEDYLYSNYHTL